jgi:L-threonylcarbamoyladenylate synthase
MEIIKVNLANDWRNPEVINKAITILERNGSLVYPTDTVYGLGVNALRVHCLERLFKIKQRPETKPVPVMIRDIAMAKKLAFVDRKVEKVLAAVWPGPVTVILEKRDIVPDFLTAGKRTIGLRIADCRLTRALMANLEEPITATSANFSGQPPLNSASEVVEIFDKAYPRPDLILDAGQLPSSQPSTLLDLTGQQPKILRVGPTGKSDLLKMLKM